MLRREMIDFNNASFVKLRPLDDRNDSIDQKLLLPDEEVLQAFQGVRDMVGFTASRIIAINVQGITGKKKDFTSLPYSRIQAFSVETAGTFDLDAERKIWLSSLGSVTFDITGSYDITRIQQFIAESVLSTVHAETPGRSLGIPGVSWVSDLFWYAGVNSITRKAWQRRTSFVPARPSLASQSFGSLRIRSRHPYHPGFHQKASRSGR